jgi:membrane protein
MAEELIATFVFMAKLLEAARKSGFLFKGNIWKIRLKKVDARQGLLIRQMRIYSLAFKRFRTDKCMVEATALTFYTLLSVVPVLALVFAIAKGFGFEKNIQEELLKQYDEYSAILKNAFVYADTLLANAKGGVIAGVGGFLLLWSVMKLLINIEATFNQIWEIKKGRTWVRKVTDFLTIMIVGPILLISSISITVLLEARLSNIHLLGPFFTFFMNLVAYLLVAGVFAFLYVSLPNTKVKARPAIYAAIVATFFFELLGWAYVKFQIGASNMSAIYGGFAALPLFLIWVQYSWYIVLFGAELAYSTQNADHFELDEEISNVSIRYKKVISLMIANVVAKRFYAGEDSLTAEEISSRLDLPSRLTRNILNDFVETGLFVEVKGNANLTYQPGITESRFTVQEVINALEQRGVNELPLTDATEVEKINKLMADMGKTMDTDTGHLLVKDLLA